MKQQQQLNTTPYQPLHVLRGRTVYASNSPKAAGKIHRRSPEQGNFNLSFVRKAAHPELQPQNFSGPMEIPQAPELPTEVEIAARTSPVSSATQPGSACPEKFAAGLIEPGNASITSFLHPDMGGAAANSIVTNAEHTVFPCGGDMARNCG